MLMSRFTRDLSSIVAEWKFRSIVGEHFAVQVKIEFQAGKDDQKALNPE